MTQPAKGPDPIVNSDRLKGSTPPESGPESSNVVGRPTLDQQQAAFHDSTETANFEDESFNRREALLEGGSFDSVAPLQDIEPKKP